MQNLQILQSFLGLERVSENINISPYITLKTTAKARFFFEARTRNDLINAKKASLAAHVPLFILGGGSNLVILKKNLEFLVVKNNYMKKEKIKEDRDFVYLLVSSGYPVTRLAKETADEGLGGIEHHVGLPGSVGGAVYMNSKWTNPVSYFGDALESAFLIDKSGKEKRVDRIYFQFAYDSSVLQKTKEIVLEAVLKLKKTDPSKLKKRGEDALIYRKKTQPFGIFSSGCFFRNISTEDKSRLHLPTTSAGYLIDKAGLKGIGVGNFIISDKHANFIIHKGSGDTGDLRKLLQIVKDRVNKKFGVKLKEEVVVL